MNEQTIKNALGIERQPLPEPKRYGWVQNELGQYLIQKTYKDLGGHEAFVLRRIGTLAGDIYRMFINSKRPEDIQKYLESHEAGHIIFGHTSDEKTKDRINKIKIRAAWPKVQDKFPEEGDWEKRFDSIIYNLVMDMEVNSKIFSHDEMIGLNGALGGEGIWPEDFGFPIGLDYNTYLNLVLQDPKKFLDDVQDKMDQNSDGEGQEGSGDGQQGESSEGEGQESQSSSGSSGNGSSKVSEQKSGTSDGKESESGEGDGDSQEDSDKSGKSSGKGTNKKVRSDGKFSEDDLKKLADYYDKNSEEKKEEVAKQLEEAESIEMSNSPSEGSSGTGHSIRKIQEVEMVTFQSIENDLKAQLTKDLSMVKRDQLYNYNRNKHNSNVLIPRVSKTERHEPACMYVLLDVSGSIATESIVSFVNAFKAVSKKLNKKSRIILWDTELVSDNSVKDDIEPCNGGGTDMARGVAYIAKTYHPSGKDFFFMVSDFQDDLNDWNEALKLLNCQKKAYIFDYGSSEEDCKDTFKQMGEYIQKSGYGAEMTSLWKNTKGINISC